MGTRKQYVGAAVGVAFAATSACTSGYHAPNPIATTPSISSAPTSNPAASRSVLPKTAAAPTRPGSSSAARPAPSVSGGAEGATQASVGQCRITSPAVVAASYGGKVGRETAGTSGIGNPICQFVLTRSNSGVPGTVSVTVNESISPTAFAKIKQQAQGAVAATGIGNNAFYLPSTATMQFIKGQTSVVIQADLRAPGGQPPNPDQTRADTVALARAIALNL